MINLLVIVHDLDIDRAVIAPTKAQAKLIVDANADDRTGHPLFGRLGGVRNGWIELSANDAEPKSTRKFCLVAGERHSACSSD